MTAIVPLSFDITFIDAAPRGPQQQVGNLALIEALPFGNLCRCFVFTRPGACEVRAGGKLVQNVLLEEWTDFRLMVEIPLTA
jgi:hypothetical protein